MFPSPSLPTLHLQMDSTKSNSQEKLTTIATKDSDHRKPTSARHLSVPLPPSLISKAWRFDVLHLGSKPAIVVSSSKVASQVLKSHDLIFASRPQLSVFMRLLGNGKDMVSSPYGEHWKQMRSICVTRLLSTKRVRSFSKVREEEVDLMMNKINGLAMVNLSEMFISLSSDVISRVSFGKKYRFEGGVDFPKLLDEYVRLLGGYYIGDYISWLAWIDRMNGVEDKVNETIQKFDGFLERILQEHLSRRRGGDGVAMGDFVDDLLDAQGDDTSANFCPDTENIKGLILNLFAAGTDTTYIALEWTMSELFINPRVMDELRKQVRAIAGDKEAVFEDDLGNMTYLKAVIKESLRLHPPTPLTPPHESIKDAKVNGYDVVAGTMLIVNIWAISRDPAYWEEPESFYPERFLDSPIDFKRQDFELISFGSGRRMCPGMAFATVVVELVIANLVHQFDWALPNGVDEDSLDMDEAPGLAVHRRNPLLAIPIPRF